MSRLTKRLLLEYDENKNTKNLSLTSVSLQTAKRGFYRRYLPTLIILRRAHAWRHRYTTSARGGCVPCARILFAVCIFGCRRSRRLITTVRHTRALKLCHWALSSLKISRSVVIAVPSRLSASKVCARVRCSNFPPLRSIVLCRSTIRYRDWKTNSKYSRNFLFFFLISFFPVRAVVANEQVHARWSVMFKKDKPIMSVSAIIQSRTAHHHWGSGKKILFFFFEISFKTNEYF